MKLRLFLLISVLVFSSCRTKKAAIDRQESSVSVIEQNDIVTTEKETIEAASFNLTNSTSWNIAPVNVQKPTKVIYKGDTLSFNNAKISFENTESEENTTTTTEKETRHKDESTKEIREESESKFKKKNVRSASWGLNLGVILGIVVIIIMGYFHFRT